VRSIGTIIGTAALVAGGLGFVLTPAHASSGQLTVKDGTTGRTTTYNDPAPGCYRPRFNTVINRTDRPVTVFTDENCRLGARVIQPGTDVVEVGQRLSVAIG